jgi:Trypsin
MNILHLSLGSRRSSFGKASLSLLLGIALSACEGPGAGDESEISSESSPIYYGTPATPSLGTGVVQVRGCDSRGCFYCTGTIFSRYWVITAAHCYDRRMDQNGDGQISSQEGAPMFWVGPGPGPDPAFQPKYIAPRRIFFHPSSDVDVAMVWLGTPYEDGFTTTSLSTARYTGTQSETAYLNVFFAPTSAILGSNVYSYGYGFDGMGNGYGTLRWGAKTIAQEYGGGYAASGSTSCPGDEGGPDYYVNSQGYWFVTGIHSSLCCGCGGGTDWQSAASSWRDWAYSMWASCPDRTPRGQCR